MAKTKAKHIDLQKLKAKLLDERLKMTGALDGMDGIDAMQNADALNDAAAIASHANSHISQINKALTMIDSGTYGICDQCTGPIPIGRLEIMPDCTRCVQCSGK